MSKPMTKIVSFPRGYSGPPPPAPVTDELTAVELKLARARLAQVKAETRMANNINAEYAWRCFKKALFWLFVAWLAWQFTGPAKAEPWTSRSYYGANGSFAGSSVKRGNHTSFYDAQGRFSGSEINYGRTRSVYGPRGNFVGSIINTGPHR